ncbi:hypothetical protein BX257_6397 [Streptomyces sp. 3212.3]|nr:hypothetical protein BX257_6397 [Streptomyces sp. 3212.3]
MPLGRPARRGVGPALRWFRDAETDSRPVGFERKPTDSLAGQMAEFFVRSILFALRVVGYAIWFLWRRWRPAPERDALVYRWGVYRKDGAPSEGESNGWGT